jgi:hypothetical protein
MSTPDLQVSIPPLPEHRVECFEKIAIPLIITSSCPEPIVIDSITLCFKTDADMSDYFLKVDMGYELAPHSQYLSRTELVPTPQFLPGTNEFHILVRYRIVSKGVPGDHLVAKSPGSYIIVKWCSRKLGQLFVSFKQPEDRGLARMVEEVAKRAGFQPYLAMNEPTPGMGLWDRIEPRLLESVAVVFIWTEHTEWGDGVAREIKLCKSNNIQNVLLIQRDLPLPKQFKGTRIEYQRFDPEDPLEEYSEAITALRGIILSRSSVT